MVLFLDTSKNIIPTEINPSDINSIARHCNDMNILPSKIQFSTAVVLSASNNFYLKSNFKSKFKKEKTTTQGIPRCTCSGKRT